ncbi:Hypothetical protein POVN_LOCUS339 [uncultured virus]|nr:Hypothetical protein POVN_LOCUS339 [uncultured virus]
MTAEHRGTKRKFDDNGAWTPSKRQQLESPARFERVWTCGLGGCSETFQTRDELRHHASTVHKLSVVVIPKREVPAQATKHSLGHGRSWCEFCGAELATRNGVPHDIETCNRVSLLAVYRCGKCPRRFVRPHNFKNHVKICGQPADPFAALGLLATQAARAALL